MNKDGCHNDKCIGFSPYATEKKNCSVTWDNDPQTECEKYQARSEAGSAEFALLCEKEVLQRFVGGVKTALKYQTPEQAQKTILKSVETLESGKIHEAVKSANGYT